MSKGVYMVAEVNVRGRVGIERVVTCKKPNEIVEASLDLVAIVLRSDQYRGIIR